MCDFVLSFFASAFFVIVFAANNNQQPAIFCRSLARSQSLLILNCLCVNKFRTISSLPQAHFMCLYVLRAVAVERKNSQLLLFAIMWFRYSFITWHFFYSWSHNCLLLSPHFLCLHIFSFNISKSFKVVISVALVPREQIIYNNKIIYTITHKC